MHPFTQGIKEEQSRQLEKATNPTIVCKTAPFSVRGFSRLHKFPLLHLQVTSRSIRNFIVFITFTLATLLQSCHKDNPTPEATIETDSITDIDGNVYKTVKIGNQWWMAENLRVTKYRNGYFIPETKDSNDWVAKTQGAYCLFENDPATDESLGLLYNHYVITDTGNIAPQGWHIPSDAEWKQLEMHLGMSSTDCDKSGWRGSNEADKLKMKSPEGWTPYGTVWSTNESGFTALAASCRLNNAAFGQPGLFSTGFWWTSTSNDGGDAYYRYLDYKNSNIYRSHVPFVYGMSIRCVKD